jgi:hypothetical protein
MNGKGKYFKLILILISISVSVPVFSVEEPNHFGAVTGRKNDAAPATASIVMRLFVAPAPQIRR